MKEDVWSYLSTIYGIVWNHDFFEALEHARCDVIVLSKQVMKLAVCLIVAVILFTASNEWSFFLAALW